MAARRVLNPLRPAARPVHRPAPPLAHPVRHPARQVRLQVLLRALAPPVPAVRQAVAAWGQPGVRH